MHAFASKGGLVWVLGLDPEGLFAQPIVINAKQANPLKVPNLGLYIELFAWAILGEYSIGQNPTDFIF